VDSVLNNEKICLRLRKKVLGKARRLANSRVTNTFVDVPVGANHVVLSKPYELTTSCIILGIGLLNKSV